MLEAGIIFQHYTTVFVASYQTREIMCDGKTYSYKKIHDTILTNNAGIENKELYYVASKERAFLDTLYLNKHYYFDNLSPLDFDKIFELLPIYNNKRMVRQVHKIMKQQKETKKLS